MRLNRTLLSFLLGCGLAASAQAPPQTSSAPSLNWDQTFRDTGGSRPLHFVAHYTDSKGQHRLEEWRSGTDHLRRLTDARIDLHADSAGRPIPNQATEYIWQIIDLQKKIDNRISSTAMLKVGLFYSFYSMAHVVSRPAGKFRLVALPGEATVRRAGLSCSWFELTPDAQPAQRICWSAEIGAPLELRSLHGTAVWTTDFSIDSVDHSAIAPAVFAVNIPGLRVRNMDSLQDED